MNDELATDNWRNKGGTVTRTLPKDFTSWLSYYKCNAGYPEHVTLRCFVDGCPNNAEHGGHMYRSPDRTEYIVPLCPSCNNRKNDVFTLIDGVFLIPANVSK